MLFEIFGKLLDCGLNRPRGGVAERAEGIAFDVVAQIQNQLRVFGAAFATGYALEDFDEPVRALATGRAPAAGFVLVKLYEIFC